MGMLQSMRCRLLRLLPKSDFWKFFWLIPNIDSSSMSHVKVMKGIGIDISDIARFRTPKMRGNASFIQKNFTTREREYCFSYRDPAPHLAGTFAAKEAVRKVYGDKPMMLADIEVRHRTSGKPEIWINSTRSRILLISISHNATIAIAIALKQS